MKSIISILLAGTLQRYHTCPIDVKQALDSHSWEVAMFVLKLAPDCSKNLLIAALSHDLGESVTGDVPSPCKRRSASLKKILDTMEKSFLEFVELGPMLTAHEAIVLKEADNLSGIWHCRKCELRGDSFATEIKDKFISYLKPTASPTALKILKEIQSYGKQKKSSKT